MSTTNHRFKSLSKPSFKALPTRGPPPEVAAMVPNVETVREELDAGYRNLDQSTTEFNYPAPCNCSAQLVLIPSSYAHLSVFTITPIASARTSTAHEYDVYGNLFYSLEGTLLESFTKVILRDGDGTTISLWEDLLRAWIAHMVGYLEVNNDAVDESPDEEVQSSLWPKARTQVRPLGTDESPNDSDLEGKCDAT
jgi:hypothetical protein